MAIPTPQEILPAQLNSVLANPRVQELKQGSLNFYTSNLGALKAAGILLTTLFLVGTIFFMIKTGWLALRVDRIRDVILKSNMPKRRSIKAWRKIQKNFFAGDDNSLKLAILEADKTLDEALRLAGFRGDTLGDRLQKIDASQLANIQEIWEAHKLRNRLVHEQDFKLNRDTAERALAIYKQTFESLGLLD